MTLTLSDHDYKRLMLLTLLGEWVINAIRKDPDPSYEDTVSKVLETVRGTQNEVWIAYDHESGRWMPSEKLEAEAHSFIDEYDDKTFWEELTARLTERDLVATHGDRAIQNMRPYQKSHAAKPIAKTYTKEFEGHGLDRVRVVP